MQHYTLQIYIHHLGYNEAFTLGLQHAALHFAHD